MFYQMMAEENIEALNGYNVIKVHRDKFLRDKSLIYRGDAPHQAKGASRP
jgi:hypothetical protein